MDISRRQLLIGGTVLGVSTISGFGVLGYHLFLKKPARIATIETLVEEKAEQEQKNLVNIFGTNYFYEEINGQDVFYREKNSVEVSEFRKGKRYSSITSGEEVNGTLGAYVLMPFVGDDKRPIISAKLTYPPNDVLTLHKENGEQIYLAIKILDKEQEFSKKGSMYLPFCVVPQEGAKIEKRVKNKTVENKIEKYIEHEISNPNGFLIPTFLPRGRIESGNRNVFSSEKPRAEFGGN